MCAELLPLAVSGDTPLEVLFGFFFFFFIVLLFLGFSPCLIFS